MPSKEIEILLNGVEEITHDGVSIAQLMEISGEGDEGVIVELNGRFVYAREYSTTLLREGDRVEFIYAACGG